MNANEREQSIIEKYNKWIYPEDDWWIFMNDGFCPLDENGYPKDFDDIKLSEKYKIWKYQTYMYKVLLQVVGITHNNDISSNKVLLDVGCGKGGGISFYSDYYKFKKLIGIDLNPNHINFAKKHVSNAIFLSSTSTKMPLEDNSVDIITAVETCGYYEPFEKYVSEIKRILKPDGIYVRANRSLKDEKIFLDNGFKKIKLVDINANVRISCAISKWKFLSKSPIFSNILFSDETNFFSEKSFYNILCVKNTMI
jgi:ubiquinone/menaquinone biosynthesis C-methylase UbiE